MAVDRLHDVPDLFRCFPLAVHDLGEPAADAPRMEPENGGVIIVPALAFDRSGYRMGQGGGYYDRYLSARNLFSVGIGRSCLLCDSVLRESHDKPVSCLVTETGVYRFSCSK